MRVNTPGQQWQIVARLRPQLRRHIRTHATEYRGERWHVLHDETNGRHLRFNAAAWEFVGRLDGDLSVEEVCAQIAAAHGEDALRPDEAVSILAQLAAIDALKGVTTRDAKELFARQQAERRQRWQRAAMNPLAIRLPLIDPDRLLNRLTPWLRPLFAWWGAAAWLLVVGPAAALALANFPAIAAELDADILSPLNAAVLVAVFVCIKTVHEFAHGVAVKAWGGAVHEMGVTLLVLAPVPYVDASAAWSFRDRGKRVLVGAAGIVAELFVAAIALFVWLAVEPGAVRDVAFNAMLVGSVSTLLFNANPLLRYDGYYVLQDLVEIPNLSSRANRYYLYLVQRYLFGLRQARSPVTARGERAWFLGYGFCAFFYRLFVLVAIVLFLGAHYYFIGVALATWAVITGIVVPLGKAVRFLGKDTALGARRPRAIAVSLLLLAAAASTLLLVPVPQITRAEGVVWVPEQAQVYARSAGFVTEVLATPGAQVEQGTPLLRMHAPELSARIAVLEARKNELETRRATERLQRRVQSKITEEELRATDAELALLREQEAMLDVTSPLAGTFVLAERQQLDGRYFAQGQMIGYVVSPDRLIVRAVVPQADIGLVREHVARVEVRLAEELSRALTVSVVRETPAGSNVLPSRALGSAGGGEIAVRVDDSSGVTAAEKIFAVDLGLPPDTAVTGLGERAYVRFEHGAEPLAWQWWRSGRQLLLSRLSV